MRIRHQACQKASRALCSTKTAKATSGLERGPRAISRAPAGHYSLFPTTGPSGSQYLPICEDHAGAIWIGAWPGSVSRFKNGRFTNYTKRDGLSGEEITALYEDRAGRLWVGEYGQNNGLRVFHDGRFNVPSGLKDLGLVFAMDQDCEGAFWLGTENKLVRYKDGVATSYTTKDGLAGNDVRVIIADAAGNLWIGSYGGLTRYCQGKFTHWTERDGLPSDSVRALYEDAEGVLWIGTYDGGLGRFKDGKFTRYTTREGLFNDGAFQILEDARGNLWMSCNRGIYRVSKQQLNEFAAGQRSGITSIAYGNGDGMLNAECNGGCAPAGVKARDGKLWFPTQNGVAVIDPDAVPINREPPPVAIESCLIDRAPVALDRPVRIRPGHDSFKTMSFELFHWADLPRDSATGWKWRQSTSVRIPLGRSSARLSNKSLSGSGVARGAPSSFGSRLPEDCRKTPEAARR